MKYATHRQHTRYATPVGAYQVRRQKSGSGKPAIPAIRIPLDGEGLRSDAARGLVIAVVPSIGLWLAIGLVAHAFI